MALMLPQHKKESAADLGLCFSAAFIWLCRGEALLLKLCSFKTVYKRIIGRRRLFHKTGEKVRKNTQNSLHRPFSQV